MTIDEAIAAAITEDPTREDWTPAQWFEFLAPAASVVLQGTVYANGALTGTLGETEETDPVSRIVAGLLETAGLGLFGETIFIGLAPAEPDACITVIDSGGRSPDAAIAVDYPNVQVWVRGPKQDYESGWDTANAVQNALNGYTATTDFLRGITMRGWITPMGQDDNERFEFSLNFLLTTSPENPGNRRHRI